MDVFVFIPSFILSFISLILMLFVRKKLTCINNRRNSLIFSVFISIFSTSAIAVWDVTYTVPELSTKYYPAIASNKTQDTIVISYSNTNLQLQVPIQPINPGSSILLKILIPPGTVLATFFGQAKTWNGLRAAEFDQDPGQFCGDNPVCEDNNLGNLSDGYNPILYGDTKKLDSSSALQQTQYIYIVLKWTGSGTFSFTSLNIQMLISDIVLYNEWRNNRPWASGPANNSIDGIGGDNFELNITPLNNGSITIKNATEIDKTCTKSEATDCKTSYPKDTELELIATAADGFVFKEWQSDCTTSSTTNGNKIRFTMNTSKTCSALFQEIPVTLTITEPYPTNGFIINKKLLTDNSNKYILCREGVNKDLCNTDDKKNTPAILVAVPDMGYTLDAWGDDCTGTEKSYVILLMDKDYKCSATFKKCN